MFALSFIRARCIVSAPLQLTECNLQVESGFLPSTINWSPFSDIQAFGSQNSLIFSGLPDVFWYSILHHHLLCLLLSFFLSRLSLFLSHQTICFPYFLPSLSPIFSSSLVLVISQFHLLSLFSAVLLSLTVTCRVMPLALSS